MISIIIPCRNRIDSLLLCIDSVTKSIQLFNKTFDTQCEIIVVDDNSSDGFAERVIYKHPEVRVVSSDGYGPGYARNFGIRNAVGEYLFFTDSDCVVDETWISMGYNILKKTNSTVVQGVPWLFQKNKNPYLSDQEEKLYELMFSSYIRGEYTLMTDSRNLLMNKRILDSLTKEVFCTKNKSATAESRVFGERCYTHGINVVFAPDVKIYHEDSLTITDMCLQKYRHGTGRVLIWNEIPSFGYLEERYFSNPINNEIDVDYVLPGHASFLMGYFQALGDLGLYSKFLRFLQDVFTRHARCVEEYQIIKSMLVGYGAESIS